MSMTNALRDNVAQTYWTLLALCLCAWLTGDAQAALAGALALGGAQLLHFRMRHAGFAAFPLQVRGAYLLLLALGMFDALRWIHWVQLVGTSAVVSVGYCPLARLLSLLPWNRRGALSAALIRATLLTPPGAWQPEWQKT